MIDYLRLCNKNMLIQGVVSDSAAILVDLNSGPWMFICEHTHKAQPLLAATGLVHSVPVEMAMNGRGTRLILQERIFTK